MKNKEKENVTLIKRPMLNQFKVLLYIPIILLISCANRSSDKPSDEKRDTIETLTHQTQEQKIKEYEAPSVNDSLATQIGAYLTNKFQTKADLNVLPVDERKFQLWQIDLNNDGKNEIFIRFVTRYFCGSGGCTILLLTHDLKKITTFTVMEPPIFAEKEIKNGYKTLRVFSEGEWRELIFHKGSYPSNPSVARITKLLPGSSAEVLFDDNNEFFESKTYSF